MQKNQQYISNKCIAYKSLPNVFFLPKSNRILQLKRSHSLPSCSKFFREPSQFNNQQNKSHPTIGELLGDNDLFHYHNHNRYSSSRFKRKQYHHRSYSRSTPYYNHRKQRRSNYSTESHHQQINDQIYFYPTTYNYPSLPTYCYYCYSNMTTCCPYLISNCYTGFYQQEISTCQYDY